MYEGLPTANWLFWELELFETIFHEVLEGVDDQLWRTGEWHPDIPAWLLGQVLPRLPLHVGRLYSRAPRPPLPHPSAQHSGTDAVLPFPEGDEYGGWYRCGYFEMEIATEFMHRVTAIIKVMSSVNFPKEPGEADLAHIPLAHGEAEIWLEPQRHPRLGPLGLPSAAAGLDFVRDWMSRHQPHLMLQPYIQSRLGLSPGDPWHGPLELVDQSGKAAVVFRCWEERPVGEEFGDEVARLQGCDLIMRLDVFARMIEMYEHTPITVTYVRRDEREE